MTGGLRYQRDRQDRTGSIGRSPRFLRLDYSETFSAWLPRLSAAYTFAPRILAGVTVQRAYNPGGVTLAVDTGAEDRFRQETLWDYEAFVRAAAADGKLTLESNIFYYDMRNAQRPRNRVVLTPDGSQVFVSEADNAPRARSYGLEVSGRWRASPRLSLRAAVGLLGTRLIETSDPADQARGRSFQRSPRLSASASAEWHPSARWRLSASVRHNSRYYSDDLNTPALRIGGVTRFDASAAYSAGRVTVFAYARNLFDRFELDALTDPTLGDAGEPRQLGAGIEASF
jgi:outer membrane receptor protein involved in Fe transport